MWRQSLLLVLVCCLSPLALFSSVSATPAMLSAINCGSASMTGAGVELCRISLVGAAPAGGVAVNLRSSNAAVALPNTVVVPANATSVGFTATVSSLGSALAVTLTASQSGASKVFVLWINPAVPLLGISPTNLAFGNTPVNSEATRSVALQCTGVVPVTVTAATVTGADFSVSGSSFPVTLNPGQRIMLNVQFHPSATGAAVGGVAIASNSSTNAFVTVSLSGTGQAPKVVTVAVSPTSISITPGATQLFSASVKGTTDTTVIWTMSGTGCNLDTCGNISSTGLYTAPPAISVPATVTITATSKANPGRSASAYVTLTPSTGGTTYYLATAADGGNDSNSGRSADKPWLTPHHPVNCGDVILAEPSDSYASDNFETGKWGTVNCPAGNNVAWLKCATFDTCKITASAGEPGFFVDKSYWGVQGWEVTAPDSTSGWCFGAAPNLGAKLEIHHIVFANNVANGCQHAGFDSFKSTATAGVDYLAIVGNIAYDAARWSKGCGSGIAIYEPIESDSLPGTHIYVAGNFAWGNIDSNPCGGGTPTDGEGIIFDAFDGDQGNLPTPYRAQAVADNNIVVANGGRGLQADYNSVGNGPFASIYFRHNTMWGNNRDLNENSVFCGEMMFYATVTSQATLNLAVTDAANGCGANPIYAYFVGASPTTTDVVDQNWGYAASGANHQIIKSAGFSYGAKNIFGLDPRFANPTAPGPPHCGGYSNVPACMAIIIENFTPTNPAAAGYGYQVPSASPVFDPLFPQWLCNVNLPAGLVSMGCQKAAP